MLAGLLALPLFVLPDAPPDPGEPPRQTAIAGARIIDGTGAPPRDGCVVLLRGERIAAVGPGVVVPKDAEVVDGKGKSLIPGMFDTHGHCFTVDGKDQYEAYPLLFLAGGVTTTFSPGEMDPEGAFALRERLQSGAQAGARLLSAGPYFEKGQGELAWLKGYADEAEALAWLARYGPRMDGLKLQMQITQREAKAILDDAHRRGIKVTGHLGSVTARRAVELGIDRLEHGLFAMSEFAPASIRGLEEWSRKFETLGALDLDSAPVQELVDLIVRQRVALSATTASFEEWAPGWVPVTPDWEKYLAPPARRLAKAQLARRQSQPEEIGRRFAAGLKKQLEFLKLVHDRGGIVVTGTDPGGKLLIPGFGLHRELLLLVQAGFTPLAAIRAATQHSAWALGVDRDLGTIEAGKLADVVLVAGDPAQDIAAVTRTVAVWKAGKRFDPLELRKAAEGRIQ
jgi:imidazolonepropionase-like amidohydrolase